MRGGRCRHRPRALPLRSRCSAWSWRAAAHAAGFRTNPAPRTDRSARARCGAPRSRRGRRCGIPPPPRDARTTARRRRAAVLRTADATAPADAWGRRVLGLGSLGLGSLGCGSFGLQALATSDSWLSSFRTRIRAYGTTLATRKCEGLPQPFSFIRTLTVGFGFTPNLLTLFLRFPKSGSPKKKALAGLGYVTLTAGGDFHPALRTSAARLGNLPGLCRMEAVPARTFTMGNPHVPMTPERNWAILQTAFGRKLND